MIPPVTPSQLSSSLLYDPESGLFFRIKKNGDPRSRPTGVVSAKGYIRLLVEGRTISAGRAAYMMMTGREISQHEEIDHINHIKTDNRWSNLRLSTKIQNNENRSGAQSNTTTGYRGVSFNKKSSRYEAYLKYNGKHRRIGWFDRAEDADEFVSLARAMTMEFSSDAKTITPRRPTAADLMP